MAGSHDLRILELKMNESEDAHVKHRRLKHLLRSTLGFLKLNSTYSLSRGISVFGLNIFPDRRPGPLKYRATYALDYVLALNPETVLDVGSGGGKHAQAFRKHGCKVTCIDYGTSIYADNADNEGLEVIHADFNSFESPRKFDLVWASHILEHQRNPGLFIERLVEACAEGGHVCITVPDPHRNLWGGHVSLWTPGLLAYNVALCGVDLSDSRFIRGSNEFSLLFRAKRVPVPADLHYDYGDLEKLAKYLPEGFAENSDPWRVSYHAQPE
jgi:2-polyprenyl-3-methyl-5-hydroxy-6-metoxy-1,4-benzoquinol methylase